jgi:hypothetical protein
MTQAIPQWGRIPSELRSRAQWLIASPDKEGRPKVPTTVLADGTLAHGSSTDRSTWLTFDQAAMHAFEKGWGIGYCIAYDDPFACIDLDVKGPHNEPDQSKWSTQQQLDRFWLIAQAFDSYTEVSTSGKGLHIWLYGSTMDGARHDGVEIYAQSRFMVCTGNVLFDKPISDRQALLDQLYNEIRAHQGASRKAADLDQYTEEDDTDDEIITRAATADNSHKFNELFAGRWEQFNFPSQSEADLALMSMFTFYSRNDEQCRRLFRRSALGLRDKAQKDDRYLDYTLKLIRGRQADEAARDAKFAQQAQRVVMSMEAQAAARAYAASLGPVVVDPSTGEIAPVPQEALPPPPVQAEGDTSLSWPPGFAGALAGFVFRSAPRPVKEVAIVAALGWLAGVCGKMWNIPGSGLNIYLILVARSAVGKEAMHSGLGALLAKLRESVPSAQEFVDFNDFASGPALVKACAANPCFLNVAGEWGRKLKRLSQDGDRDGPMQQLRTVMTNLYQKSGPASVVGGLSYSNKENNIASVSGVAYSMIGESTPGTFYDSLTESMMEDGFLSRFTIVEYAGDRPPANPHQQMIPEQPLVERCIELVMQSKTLMGNRAPPIMVMRDQESAAIMNAFDHECDAEINKTSDESWRQMWNRAQLKMMRIAALLAVGDNPHQPCITAAHTNWALEVIRRDIAIMKRRIESGDVGTGDGTRERKLIMLMRDYLEKPVGLGYHIPEGMREAGIVPRSFLQIRTARLSAFTQARNGATQALDFALRSCCDSGYIMEVDKTTMADKYGSTGRAYRVVNLPSYDPAGK